MENRWTGKLYDYKNNIIYEIKNMNRINFIK